MQLLFFLFCHDFTVIDIKYIFYYWVVFLSTVNAHLFKTEWKPWGHCLNVQHRVQIKKVNVISLSKYYKGYTYLTFVLGIKQFKIVVFLFHQPVRMGKLVSRCSTWPFSDQHYSFYFICITDKIACFYREEKKKENTLSVGYFQLVNTHSFYK